MNDSDIKIHDCWNLIGSRSPKGASCERLKNVITCVNCDVYVKAGRRLLHRDAPAGYIDEWVEIISTGKTSKKKETTSVIIFKIQNQLVALPSRLLDKVVVPGRVHTLPHNNSPYIAGVTNVQGELAVSLDINRLLVGENGRNSEEESRFPRDVVINLADGLWAFEVEEVVGIERLKFESVALEPERWCGDEKFIDSCFLWKNQTVIMLDETVIENILRGIRM
ncbi:MAG: chemotaxis protein CheW [Gammaproteobacteria bacterium]|nr:chemotaxis protein CheW [Gammaproteobacteria bacterium]